MKLFGFIFKQTKEEDTSFYSKNVVNLCFFFTHEETVFFETQYFSAMSLLAILFSKSFKALDFTPIGLLFNLRFMGTIFPSQRTNNGLFEFTMLCLCCKDCMIRKRCKIWILVKKFELYWKSSDRLEKLWVMKKNLSKGPTNLFDLPICSSFRVFNL